MIRLLGFLAFKADRLLDKIWEAANEYEIRRQDQAAEKRRAWLITLDPEEVRKEGRLASIILAGQVEAAKREPPPDWDVRLR
jgi:hypothetical protein